jgi:hypothetical protein
LDSVNGQSVEIAQIIGPIQRIATVVT